MRTRINRFDEAAREVDVTFVYNGIKHRRRVNAVLDADGVYDEEATRLRVADVALGVVAKIGEGVFGDPPAD